MPEYKRIQKGEIQMTNFVKEDSIVRKIWSSPDTILFIFAGSSAEFALNKAVDWLYFTGSLPADPIARLFSTVEYARKIVFSSEEQALNAIDQITAIHKKVEANRGISIPEWAYRDVLYMLIDYSIRSFEVLERPLTDAERIEIFTVFTRVGLRMGINDLPANYTTWQESRAFHLETDLAYSNFTTDLFKQYRKHLGFVRYSVLKEAQKLVIPDRVRTLLSANRIQFITPFLAVYKSFRFLDLHTLVRGIILPDEHKTRIEALGIPVNSHSQ